MAKSILRWVFLFPFFALTITLLILFIPISVNAQKDKTYMRAEFIRDCFCQLFTDAGKFGDIKKGQIVLITRIEKEYFRFDYTDSRSVVSLKSNFRNPDSLVRAFELKTRKSDSLELSSKRAAIIEEQRKVADVNGYLKKYGSNIDKYCFQEKKIMIGMSDLIFGWVKQEKPLKKNITSTKYGTDEQWIYPNNVYYYFTNKVLEAIQEN